jgi:Na+-transporting NADH:ubiquinone oxidoreductase subunit NqrC
MNSKQRLRSRIFVLLVCGVFAAGAAYSAQQDERNERDKQKTKQAQAVSKEVYEIGRAHV